MAFASYRIYRRWLFWRWVADYHGVETREGFALFKGSARWGARSWLRSKGRLLRTSAAPDQAPADGTFPPVVAEPARTPVEA